MRIDHIGYAVRDICQAIKEFRKLGFSFEDIVDDPDRNLYIAFGENGGYRKVIVPEAPALAFGGRRVVFLMNLNVGLVEIVEVSKQSRDELRL